MSGSQYLNVRAKGLSTLNNPLSEAVAQGSLSEAVNVVIDRNEVIEPRRGFNQYGNTFGDGTDRAKQLINYKDVILRHVLSTLQYDTDGNGTFESFAGGSVVEIQSGLRIKSLEANGNLYFTTLDGIKKLSAKTAADFPDIAIQDAGAPKALDVQATPNYSNSGFLEANSKVAYRVLWGYTDNNDNLLLGSPSARAVVYNVSTTNSCFVNLKFAIPNEIQTTNYFYQVYRTGITTGDITPSVIEPSDPGDEMYLVFEDNVTAPQLSAGIVEVVDITPEDFRKNGTLLYTNPTSGDGIESANEKPPFAKDIALYKNYTFYANTSTVQRLNFSFLSIQDFVSNVTNFVVQDGTSTNTYLFQGSLETYTADFTGSAAADFYNGSPATAKYFTLESANDSVKYCVWYYKSVNDLEPSLSGYLNVKVDISALVPTIPEIIDETAAKILLATNDFNISSAGTILTIACANNGYVTDVPSTTIASPFDISKDGLGTGEDAAAHKIFLPRVPTGAENGPTVSQQLEQVATSLVNVLNDEDTIVYAYYQSGFNDVPGAVLLEQQDTTGPSFWITSNEGQEFNPTLPASGSTVTSTNEIAPNRVYYSKLQQPEAVPLANYLDVGPKDREIKRIIALRDSLFIFKEDGIYRLSGDVAPFTVAPFDFSTQVLAADTAVVLNNQIYALSTQGVCVVTDTGVQIISRPIENQLLKIARQPYAYQTASFGVSYETDRSYLLFTVTNENDVVATQAFRYNTFTSCWTKWDKTQTCGIVNFADDKLYMGAGDINFIEKERKNLTRDDHADREYELQIPLNGVVGDIVSLNNIGQASIGDVLIQRQYLTGAQFNQLLDKLDRDIGVSDQNYDALLHYYAGQDLRSKLNDLSLKLDLDPGVNQTNFNSSIADYTYSISLITPSGSNTILQTSVNHSIKVSRYITLSGTDNDIDGTYRVNAVTSNTITIERVSLTSGTSGTLQTDINDFRDMQACYNIITALLNTDTSVFYTNYPSSNGIIDFEVVILSINKNNNSVVVKAAEGFLFGVITLYKAILSTVIWNPIYFQDPSITKQVREGTMIFENSNFSKVTIAYGTDLSPAFVPITFEGPGLGVGDFGYFAFGSINWGGVAAPIPLRTLIPLEKQRCRFMNIRFQHKVAFEKYAIYGLSLTFRPIGPRGYR
jgi:hypothetical protein